MIPSFIGLFTIILGCWLTLRRSPLVVLCFVMAFGILEGSAAILLTALGGSSIQPGRVMLGFLILSCLPVVRQDAALARRTVVDNGWLVIFGLYGAISAIFLPRIFEGQMDVVPLRPTGLRHMFDAFPLHFSSQNITTAIYLLGTVVAALSSYIAVARSRNLNPIVTAAVSIAVIHSVLGILGVALKGTPWDQVVEFFRNGSYAQLNQKTEGFARISGFMPEPSNYARFGLVWFILCFELWLRHIRPVATGAAAALMGLVLLASTSSTAYLGIAGYAAILACRALFGPTYFSTGKLLAIAGVSALGLVAVAAALLASPGFVEEARAMLVDMTVGKSESFSGQQRAFWARQGYDAFILSRGLGIGAGSFRSSSIAMAILGGMGVIGVISLLAYIVRLAWPVARDRTSGESVDFADSLTWAAVAGLLPSLAIQPSPDPGMEFACLAGAALALKSQIWRRSLDRQPRLHRFENVKVPTVDPATGWRHVSK